MTIYHDESLIKHGITSWSKSWSIIIHHDISLIFNINNYDNLMIL